MMQPSGAKQGEKIIVRVDPDIEDIVPLFFEKLNEEIDAALQSLEQANYEDIHIWGHNLKGAGSGYGFDPISEIGKSLEQAAETQNSEEIHKLVDELSTYLAQVDVVYE